MYPDSSLLTHSYVLAAASYRGLEAGDRKSLSSSVVSHTLGRRRLMGLWSRELTLSTLRDGRTIGAVVGCDRGAAREREYDRLESDCS